MVNDEHFSQVEQARQYIERKVSVGSVRKVLFVWQ